LTLSERNATNIGLLYPKVRNNIGDIPVDVPTNQNIGGCVPGIPGGVDASVCEEQSVQPAANDQGTDLQNILRSTVRLSRVYRKIELRY